MMRGLSFRAAIRISIVGADDAQGVGPLDPPQAAAHGLQHVAALVIVMLQQLGHHLRVRVGGEADPLAHQVLLELHVVFDDAVVDDGDPAVLADVGMGVDVVGLPVGGPAGVADAQAPVQIRAAVDQVRQGLQPAPGLADLEPHGLRAHRHAGGVIAPVLHPRQSVQQDGGRRLSAYKSDDSAHEKILLRILF